MIAIAQLAKELDACPETIRRIRKKINPRARGGIQIAERLKIEAFLAEIEAAENIQEIVKAMEPVEVDGQVTQLTNQNFVWVRLVTGKKVLAMMPSKQVGHLLHKTVTLEEIDFQGEKCYRHISMADYEKNKSDFFGSDY
ncbi:hypothetical protein RZS08_06810 [Arthrospira platensis SPKY1]|nr:hypothetical protein [Arthrospira platensis SPKY1]